MAKTDSPEHAVTHLLVVTDDKVTTNRLISNLRHEGLALRGDIASDKKQLTTLLIQDQWDVLVYYDTAGIELEELLKLLAKHEQDIPVILVHASNQVAENLDADALLMFRKGVRDVVPADRPNQLLVSITREAQQYAQKKQQRRMEIKQQELEKRHKQLLSDSPLAISYIRDGIHLYCNQSYADIFAYAGIDTVSTTPFLNLISTAGRTEVKSLLSKAEDSPQNITVPVRKQDGSEAELLLNFTPVEYMGKRCLQLTALHPGGNAQHSAEVARLTSQDLLTQLENRSFFMMRIETAIRTAVQKGIFSSLIIIEVNDFENIAVAIGKSSSNLVLNDIALYLQAAIDQPCAAGRLDDHLFGIILHDGDPDAALALCNQIREKINNRISSAMLASLELNCSVGMALINGHALNANDIIVRARTNMKQKLGSARGTHTFRIRDSLGHDAQDMLEYLTEALEKHRFKPVFQPIVGINGNNQRCYEVLIRMLDKDDNEILPGAFLPLANMNGMGEQLDRMVVNLALESLLDSSAVQQLTINITNNTLMSQTFLPWLSEQLRTSRMQADRLAIDISEIFLHSSRDQALAFCEGLNVLGVKLTISQFGCALEPFALLDQLNPQFVTLDETVVRDLIYSSHQKANVQAMVSALHARHLLVVAPRVEDMAVLPALWEIGVDFVQGYCVQAPSNEMNYDFVQDEEITLTAPSR